MAGALDGVTVIELAGIGPAPFAGMMLADHGARVIRIERPDNARFGDFGDKDILNRNREIVTLDLKKPEAVEQVLALVSQADALIEGNRPGVIERLGLGPDVLLARNPRLVIGRMTGWGQDGPKAQRAGHDINYIALSGALHTFGPQERPMAPVNIVGDYGGGGMFLAFGLLAGILSARTTGKGQVVDAAMVDGAAVLSAMTYTMFGTGMWQDERGVNVLDGAAPFYDTYETADGKFVSIGSIEPQFYAILMEKLGLASDPAFAQDADPATWPKLKERLRTIFKSRTRDDWCAIMEDTDICFAPVLSLAEAPHHPHNVARGTFVEAGGIIQPAPAPRFLGTPASPVRMSERFTPLFRKMDPMVRLITAAILLATFLPVEGRAHVIAQMISNAAVFILFLLYGLRLSRREVLAGLGNHRLLLPLVAFVFGAMTLAGWLLWQAGGAFLPPLLALGFLYLGVLPSTVQSATAYSSLAGGNVASSVVAAALINILGVFISAPLFALLAGGEGGEFHGDQLIKVMTMLLLPFAMGQLLQGFVRGWIAKNKQLITTMDRASIGIAVYVAFSGAVEQGIWTKVDALGWAGVLFGSALLMVLGYGGAWLIGGLLRLPRGDRIAMLFAGAQKSVAMGAPLATVIFPSTAAGIIILPLIVYHLVQMIVAAPMATRLRGEREVTH